MNKIAIIGSRDFPDMKFVENIVKTLCKDYPDVTIVSGGARGVDKLAIDCAITMKRKYKIFPADWANLNYPDAIIRTRTDGGKYDAKAGMRRNKLIIDYAEFIIAFWDGKSKGTLNSIDLARKAGKPINIYLR